MTTGMPSRAVALGQIRMAMLYGFAARASQLAAQGTTQKKGREGGRQKTQGEESQPTEQSFEADRLEQLRISLVLLLAFLLLFPTSLLPVPSAHRLPP